MALITEHLKRRNRDGHTVSLTHVVNTASPPHTVYMLPRVVGRGPRREPSTELCPDCGQALNDWPFCPHDGRPKRA